MEVERENESHWAVCHLPCDFRTTVSRTHTQHELARCPVVGKLHAAIVGMAYDPGALELPARRTCVWKVLLVVAAVWFWMTVYTFSLLPEQQVAAMRERAARTGTPPRHLVVLSHGMHGACARLRVPTLFVTDVLLGEQATPLQCGT